MKIAIISDSKENSGGSIHVTLSAAKSLQNLNISNLDLDFVVTQKSVYEKLKNQYNNKIKLLDENTFFFKISSFLYRNFFFKKIYHKFLLDNYFETFVKKNKYDLVFFITPSSLLLLCNKVNFIYSIWEFAHKEHPSLPEYNENTVTNKDNYYNYACKHAFKIILFNEKSKNDFYKYYLVDKSKLETFFFGPLLTNIPVKNNSKIDELIKNKKYIFYPAQFWPHKNHIYLLEALKKYNENKEKKIFLILTGHDKGNLTFIKNRINNLGIINEVFIFNYLNDDEICYLYKNCFAVAFPSLVGSQSLPLFEAFFFQKPIIYNQKILDPFYKDSTLALNIDDYQNLGINIEKIINNPKLINDITKRGLEIYKASLNENIVQAKLSKIFKHYQEYQNLWKNF
jgi:glycosyltransferase involved in cell wall biosynthesis